MNIDQLPIAKSKPARAVIEHVPRLEISVERSVEAGAFFAACIREANKLKDCEPLSVLHCVYAAAKMGMIPGSDCYFVPFNKRGSDLKQCQLIIGYRGLLELAIASQFIVDVHTDVVTTEEKNKFKFYKTQDGPQLSHDVGLREVEPDRGNIEAAYCIYHTSGGGGGIQLVSKGELDKIAGFYGRGRNSVWNTNFSAMARKTAIRRAAKEWPASGRLADAIRVGDAEEAGLSLRDVGFPVPDQDDDEDDSHTLLSFEDVEETDGQEENEENKGT